MKGQKKNQYTRATKANGLPRKEKPEKRPCLRCEKMFQPIERNKDFSCKTCNNFIARHSLEE